MLCLRLGLGNVPGATGMSKVLDGCSSGEIITVLCDQSSSAIKAVYRLCPIRYSALPCWRYYLLCILISRVKKPSVIKVCATLGDNKNLL